MRTNSLATAPSGLVLNYSYSIATSALIERYSPVVCGCVKIGFTNGRVMCTLVYADTSLHYG